MSSFSNQLKTIAFDTNTYLNKFLLKQNKNLPLTKPMKYGLFSGGKRFRSAILVSTGKIFKVNYKTLIIISSAVECIHSYSLIHDDLPSMDNDDLRRGKLSVHKKFNEYTAILAGSSLLTLSFEILSSSDLKLSQKIKNELIKTLANYSGNSGLAGGQYFDLTYENKRVNKQKIIEMQKNKTGKLFAFCCESIAIIKGYNKKKRNKLKKLGLDIGLLFQIVDDIIDYKGTDSSIVGKYTKKDEKKGKATLINLLGYKMTLTFAQNLKNNLDREIKKYGINSKSLLASIEFLLNRKF